MMFKGEVYTLDLINKILYYFDMMLVSINSTEGTLVKIESDLGKTKEVATKVVQISLAISEIVVLLYKVYGVFLNTSTVLQNGALGVSEEKNNSYKAMKDLQKNIDIELLQAVLEDSTTVPDSFIDKLHADVEAYRDKLNSRVEARSDN